MSEGQQTELNINDLVAIRSLIDVVTQRGVFKANELSSVGVLYDKIDGFLKMQEEAQSTEQATEQQTEVGGAE